MGSKANVFRTTFCHLGPCMPQMALKAALTGNWLTQSDITSINYTVYQQVQTYPRLFEAVSGHDNVAIPVSEAILSTPVQRSAPDGTQKYVNFEYRIPTTKNIFPDYGKIYRIRIDFTLSDGYKTLAVLEGPAL